jgi:phosphate transport system substrate-binding protein
LSKKKTALISLLVIASVAIVIVVMTSSLTRFFQPQSDLTPEHDEAETTHIATNDSSSSNQTATTTTMMPTTIDIASTTSAFPFVQRWVAQYENQQPASSGNVNVDYMGDREIIIAEGGSGPSDLAIVGIPDENNNTLYIPVSAQAVAIVYNIPSFPDIPSGLRLNSTTLFLIMNGSITRWDDVAIKGLNPNLNLPDERIVVVHNGADDDNNNGSSSGSLMLLNQYLVHPRLSWPKNDSITASGPAELAEMVRKIPYSVGYVDFSYAVQTKMTYAAVGNADGDYIVPSTQSIGRALDVALQFHNYSTDRSPLQQHEQQQPPSINASRIVSDSYPMVGLYYASLLANNNNDDDDDDKEEGRRRIAAMLDFVKWVISESGGQQTLLEVQYPPIYPGNEQLSTYAKMTTDTIQKSLSN